MHVLSLLSMATLALTAPNMTRKRAEPAPLFKALDSNPSAKAIPGRYLVRLSEAAEAPSIAQTHNAVHTYSSKGFKGFAADLDDDALEAVRNRPDVSHETCFCPVRNAYVNLMVRLNMLSKIK